ncbi:MAG: hypothetical protein BWX52_01842 [Bacteroidetes bacterium ADurb.Bin013]|nr:MAG: hypothetical protein BWX52_01842 [Bacteroidetes bacterium ADurb.Bin013]
MIFTQGKSHRVNTASEIRIVNNSEIIAIETTDSILGTKPEESEMILDGASDRIIRQTIFTLVVFEVILLDTTCF